MLLLDEPLISLDPRRQQEVVELVKSLQREFAITVLFSAHELNPLLNAIDQVLYLGSGQAALGPVEEVITAPVLSKLYGSPIDVIRVQGRIFVMSGSHDVEADAHRHEYGHPHGHAHDDHAHGAHVHEDRRMFEYDFMRNAFAAATVVAIVSGIVGYFLVLRGQTFAGHALAHVGFTGATGAVLIGVSPLWGLVTMTVVAGVLHGLHGRTAGAAGRGDRPRARLRAGARPAVPAFLHRLRDPCDGAAFRQRARRSIRATVVILLGLGAICLGTLAIISRPLLFASLQPELAEAKGVSLRLYGVLFLAIVALATAECAQIVGVLLVFALMVGPGGNGATSWSAASPPASCSRLSWRWSKPGAASPSPFIPIGRRASG